MSNPDQHGGLHQFQQIISTGKVTQANMHKVQSKHEHQYTIPVESAYRGYEPRYDGGGHVTIAPSYLVVTKLRCVCGEEIER